MPNPEGGSEANQILAALPAAEKERLRPYLNATTLIQGQVLHEPGEAISDVHFLGSGLVSVLKLASGTEGQIEVGTIGREGMTGLTILLGADALTQDFSVVQIMGEAARVRAEEFLWLLKSMPVLKQLLTRRLEICIDNLGQTAICNLQHSLQQRVALWLLNAHDLSLNDALPIKHDRLAAMMGCLRPSISIAIERLAARGAIRHRRSWVDIADRSVLEAEACDCYAKRRSFAAEVMSRVL